LTSSPVIDEPPTLSNTMSFWALIFISRVVLDYIPARVYCN
jgi:hypothetical protein